MTAWLTCLALPLPQCVRQGRLPGKEDSFSPLDHGFADLGKKPVLTGCSADAAALRASGVKDVAVIPDLNERDHGDWAGRALRDLPGNDLSRWLTDPDFRPPAGESRAEVFERAGMWLRHQVPSGMDAVLAVRPAIMRVLVLNVLGGDAGLEDRLDFAPLSTVVLSRRASRWRVRI